MNKVLYRLELSHDDGSSEFEFREYKVVRETEASFYINWHGREKRVARHATKPFAFSTKEAAVISYIARKRRHIAILKHTLNLAEKCRKICRIAIDEKQGVDFIGGLKIDHSDIDYEVKVEIKLQQYE